MREEGYYWLKLNNEYVIGDWHIDQWFVIGADEPYAANNKLITWAGDTKLTPPPEEAMSEEVVVKAIEKAVNKANKCPTCILTKNYKCSDPDATPSCERWKDHTFETDQIYIFNDKQYKRVEGEEVWEALGISAYGKSGSKLGSTIEQTPFKRNNCSACFLSNAQDKCLDPAAGAYCSVWSDLKVGKEYILGHNRYRLTMNTSQPWEWVAWVGGSNNSPVVKLNQLPPKCPTCELAVMTNHENCLTNCADVKATRYCSRWAKPTINEVKQFGKKRFRYVGKVGNVWEKVDKKGAPKPLGKVLRTTTCFNCKLPLHLCGSHTGNGCEGELQKTAITKTKEEQDDPRIKPEVESDIKVGCCDTCLLLDDDKDNCRTPNVFMCNLWRGNYVVGSEHMFYPFSYRLCSQDGKLYWLRIMEQQQEEVKQEPQEQINGLCARCQAVQGKTIVVVKCKDPSVYDCVGDYGGWEDNVKPEPQEQKSCATCQIQNRIHKGRYEFECVDPNVEDCDRDYEDEIEIEEAN